jgi:hypothetical protein
MTKQGSLCLTLSAREKSVKIFAYFLTEYPRFVVPGVKIL